MESDMTLSSPLPSPDIPDNYDPPPTGMFMITREDSETLLEYVEEFQDSDSDMRSKIVATAMAALVMLRPSREPFNKGEASKTIRKWFYNHFQQPERQYVKFIRRWSARNMFYHMCRDEVMTEAEEMSGALPGSRAFLGSLQDTTTKLWKELSDDEQQLYVRLTSKWSDEPPPANIQARMASSLFKSCGVHCIVLAAHEKEDKTIVTGLYETDKPNNTQELFLSFCSDWSSAPLFKEWKRYVKQCYGGDDILTVPKSRHTTRRTLIPISVRADGRPEIPNITEADEYKTKTVQAMLRSYLITHIRYVSGNKQAKISWTQLCANPSDWIMPECTPDGFTWADPSKIRIGDIHLILEHWRERKRQCLNPLIWVKSCPVLIDAALSSEECQDCSSDRSPDVCTSEGKRHEDKSNVSDPLQSSDRSSATPISEEWGNLWNDGIQFSSFNSDEPWGGLGNDSHMGSLPLCQIYSTQEGSGSLQDDRTPAEFNALSDSDRGRPAAGPSEHELQPNDEGEGDASPYHPESNQSLSDESVKMLEVPKRPIKLTEKAKFMDAGGGKGKLTTGIFQR
ncbi:hypothetical protein V8E53_000657 [Lactarius tabidus]